MGVNPNTLTAGIPAFWSKQLQIIHHKKDVFRDIASFSEEEVLKVGNTVHRPYKNKLVVTNTGADGSYVRQAVTESDETLVVDKDRNVSFYYKELDKVQNAYEFVQEFATDSGIYLSNNIDAEVIASGCITATSVLDNAYFGGSAGDGITLNTANILQVYTTVDMLLNANNIDNEGRFNVLSPQFRSTLVQSNAARETLMGDEISTRGRMGEYMGFGLHLSNNILWTGELLIGTLPTNNDTVTLGTFYGQTITFTFVTGTPTNAGDVKAATDGATSAANLIAAINAPGTTSATFIALSAAQQYAMIMVSAVAITGGLRVSVKGVPVVTPSETLTAAADIWTPARQIQHILFGKRGSIDCVVQMKPNTNIWHRDGFIGDDVVSQEAFGVKTFNDGAQALVDVKIATYGMSATPYAA